MRLLRVSGQSFLPAPKGASLVFGTENLWTQVLLQHSSYENFAGNCFANAVVIASAIT